MVRRTARPFGYKAFFVVRNFAASALNRRRNEDCFLDVAAYDFDTPSCRSYISYSAILGFRVGALWAYSSVG